MLIRTTGLLFFYCPLFKITEKQELPLWLQITKRVE